MSTTLAALHKHKENGEKFACLTAYDASFATILEQAGVEVLLVGDSLGMVVQGHDTTLPVTLDEMVYHTANVRRGSREALILADMPFMSCSTPDRALDSAGRLMKEGGAHAVKIEGGAVMVETVRHLSERSIPVCAHLGLLPQAVHKLSGYRVQGRDEPTAQAMVADARAMQEAGADLLLIECVPAPLAERITRSVDIPVIGIGAGPACDAQVLVLYDMLGITTGKRPKFSKDFLAGRDSVHTAVRAFVDEVKSGRFPTDEHAFY